MKKNKTQKSFVFAAALGAALMLFHCGPLAAPDRGLIERAVQNNDKDMVLASLSAGNGAAKQKDAAPIASGDILLNRSLPIELKPRIVVKPTEQELAEKVSEEIAQKIVALQFENADLSSLVKLVSEVFGYIFLTDDALDPLNTAGGARSLKSIKFSFQTNTKLTKDQLWKMFITFLSMADLNIVPQCDPKTFRIMPIVGSNPQIPAPIFKSPLPTYIGVDSSTLPDTDELVRYIYFLENATTASMKSIVDSLKSTSGISNILEEQKAIFLIDKAYNIKSLMRIVKVLDRSVVPETMSVIKLRRANAADVQALYKALVQTPGNEQPKFFAKKQPTALYFPESIEMVVEPRTNALILFGPQQEVRKVEDFIIKHVDTELDKPYTPTKVYKLKYAKAQVIVDALTQLVGPSGFGGTDAAHTSGGVRGVDKFIKPMNFIAESETNQIIIQGDEDDYQKVLAIIKELDVAQPQVYIEIMILSVIVDENKTLGTQLRNKKPGSGLLGNNVAFQTSGFKQTTSATSNTPNVTQINTIQTQPNTVPGSQRLLGNLIALATGVAQGSTVIQLGADAFGVWGIFQALDTITDTELVSNPYIVATNKTPAQVTVGQTRRVATSTVFGGSSTATQQSMADSQANLDIQVIPQVNSDGMIVLNLKVNLTNFTLPDLTDATKNIRNIATTTVLANREVLALGGLLRDRVDGFTSKFPILGEIPILGWLFKNKFKTMERESLLILVSAQILDPANPSAVATITQQRTQEYKKMLASNINDSERRDPVHRAFFEPGETSTETLVDDFIFKRNKGLDDIVTEKKPNARMALASRKRRRYGKMPKSAKQATAKPTSPDGLPSSRGFAETGRRPGAEASADVLLGTYSKKVNI